jgi:DNA polymerase
MKDNLNNLIEDIRAFLGHQKMMGMEQCARHCEPEGRSNPTGSSSLPPAQPPAGRRNDVSPELESIRKDLGNCTRCKLHKGRNNIVFGVGNLHAELMFVGEGPGADEDEQGIPFVGRAGQLLTKIIQAMGIKRDDVYIGNIVKCRPPNNRNPEPDEIDTCIPFILKQIAVIQPKVIVCLGAIAAKALLNTEVPISKLRGKIIEWPSGSVNLISKSPREIALQELKPCKVIPTYHPAFLLRNPNMKRPVWEDMQVVMKELGMK